MILFMVYVLDSWERDYPKVDILEATKDVLTSKQRTLIPGTSFERVWCSYARGVKTIPQPLLAITAIEGLTSPLPHLHNTPGVTKLTIYLNTQEASWQNVGNLSQQTYIPTCERSHVCITYQMLAYKVNDLFSCSDRSKFQKWTSCRDISAYHDIKLHNMV